MEEENKKRTAIYYFFAGGKMLSYFLTDKEFTRWKLFRPEDKWHKVGSTFINTELVEHIEIGEINE